MNNKYEQLVEFIINDETDKARELFHTIVVEKSRDIYESLVSEEDLEETMGGNEVEDLVDEVSLDEEGMTEEEESEEGAMDAEEMMPGEEQDEAEIEDRVVDLEDALDELKAEFDALMAGEESEEEMMPGIHGDDEGSEEEMEGMMMSGMHGKEEMGNEEFYEAEEKDEDEDDKEDKEDKDVDESIVREYVEKVATPANSEGAAVGTGKSVAVNKKSTVAGKNDMGGTAALSKGGTADQNGNRPAASEKSKGTLVANPQNKPGANAGKTAFKAKETAVNKEEGAVNKTAPVAK